MAGEISTAFVRIRPLLTGFKGEAEAYIKTTLRSLTTEIGAAAKQNVAATETEVAANEALAGSYGAVQAATQAQVASVVESVGVNRVLAATYAEIAAAAEAGSITQITATKLAAQASIGAAVTIAESARANVAATAAEIATNEALAASYGTIAAAATAGSAEQIAATRLAAAASAAAGNVAVATAEKQIAATEAVKGSVLGLGKVLGIAFGAAIGIHFVKDLAEGAAELQKSQEVIQSEFGKSADVVQKFVEEGAPKLGIYGKVADDVAARFGILFKNMGIGEEQAAKMTVNLETLAGSLAQIRGISADGPLKALTLAMLGNTRGLKQLGISIDPVTMKYTAFKLGLISSVKDGMTPAIKAQAIYAIATERLGDFQAQAAAHADDLKTRMGVLAAQWDDAKDKLGKGLLPAFSGFVAYLGQAMPAVVDGVILVFQDLGDEVGFVAGKISKATEPIRKAIGEIRDAFKFEGNAAGFDKIGEVFRNLSPAAKVAVVAIGAITAALVIMLAAAFPITAAVVGIIALGVAFDEAYKRSARFRAIVDQVGEVFRAKVMPAIHQFVDDITPALDSINKSVAKIFEALPNIIRGAVNVASAIWDHFGGQIKAIIHDHLAATVAIIKDQFQAIAAVFALIGDILSGNWSKAWGDLKDIVKAQLDLVKQVCKLFISDIQHLFTILWQVVEIIFLKGLAKVVGLLGKIPTSFKAFGKTIGFENPFKGLADDLNEAAKNVGKPNALTKAIAARKAEIKAGAKPQSFQEAVAQTKQSFQEAHPEAPKSFDEAVKQQAAKVAAAKKTFDDIGKGVTGAIEKTSGKINDAVKAAHERAFTGIGDGVTAAVGKTVTAIKDATPGALTSARTLGHHIAVAVAEGAAGAGGPGLAAQAAAYAAEQAAAAATAKALTAANKAKNAVRTAESQLSGLKTQLAAAITKQTEEVRAAVEDAKANLTSIGQSIGQSMATIIDQPFVIASQKIQAAQNKITLEFDKKSQALKARAAEITRQQSVLSFGQDKLALSNLARGVVLPGGTALKDDPKKGLAQLQKLSATLKGGNKAALDSFILQFQGAALAVESDSVNLQQAALDAKETVLTNALQLKSEVLAVEQDTANKLKTQIALQISNLTDAFNRHVITYAQFKAGIDDIISKGKPAMQKAGKTLGTAFANNYMQQVVDLLKQAGLIATGPQIKGTTGQDAKLVNPGKVLADNQAAVAKIRNKIADKQVTLAQKQLKQQETMAGYLKTLAAGKKTAPTSRDKNPGKQTDTSKELAGVNPGPKRK